MHIGSKGHANFRHKGQILSCYKLIVLLPKQNQGFSSFLLLADIYDKILPFKGAMWGEHTSILCNKCAL